MLQGGWARTPPLDWVNVCRRFPQRPDRKDSFDLLSESWTSGGWLCGAEQREELARGSVGGGCLPKHNVDFHSVSSFLYSSASHPQRGLGSRIPESCSFIPPEWGYAFLLPVWRSVSAHYLIQGDLSLFFFWVHPHPHPGILSGFWSLRLESILQLEPFAVVSASPLQGWN